MKRLILHIGSPKAGSTSLQRFLTANRPVLARIGVDYPDLPGDESPPHWLRQAFEADEADARAALDALGAAIRGARGDVVVLSSEGLSGIAEAHAPAERIRRLAESEWKVAVDVVAFVRPQHLFLNSSYAQHVKTLVTADRFRPFLRRMINDRRFDVGRVYGPWHAAFGPRFHAIPFTARELARGLERRFFDEVGLGARLSGLNDLEPAAPSNPSPGPIAVEVHRRVAAAGGRARFGPRLRQARTYLHRRGVALGWDRERFSGLDGDVVEAVRGAFRQRNEAFAMRHWARPWETVFAADYDRAFASNEYDLDAVDPEREKEIASAAGEVLALYAAPDTLADRIGRLIRRVVR
ncbi:hypothetical protein [Prosthecomicrobium sp. N25]|uniref:hypothetical protein n=1 Tax=Prosthecomicrobium sp. N25 TaxID=3129254 RepID=UPI003077708C